MLEEKNKALDEVLDEVNRLNMREIQLITETHNLNKHEMSMLVTMVIILEKNPNITEFLSEYHESYFLDPQDLQQILNERRNFEFNDACFKKLKEFVTRS